MAETDLFKWRRYESEIILYLNNIVEQWRRFIKRRVNPRLGFFSFKTARRTIGGYEAMNMIRKGQIEGIRKGDIRGQLRFVANLFIIAAKVGIQDRPFMAPFIFCNRTNNETQT